MSAYWRLLDAVNNACYYVGIDHPRLRWLRGYSWLCERVQRRLSNRLREALERLDLRCENYVGRDHRPMFDGCRTYGRERNGEYGADRWCLPCEVRAALDGPVA